MPPPDFDTTPPFAIYEPSQLARPVVFNSPHSGRQYPPRFLAMSQLDALTLRRSEDAYVDDLFADVTAHGALLMKAHFPRAFLDVNREPYELDPRMFSTRLPPYANTRSTRVASGLGTLARIVAHGQEIYAAPLPVEEALMRIEHYHKPYHRTLKALLARLRSSFGHAVLIDCHSMPSSLRLHGEPSPIDFIIGDRFGTSCTPILTQTIFETLRAMGYHVLLNKPYAGGYITEQYGIPLIGTHAVQIEINRALYMDEDRCVKLDHFAALQQNITRLIKTVMQLDLAPHALEAQAAE